MSQRVIKAEIERIETSPYPPSQASYCKGLVAMAVLVHVINYRQQAEFERQIDALEGEYWRSKGIPA